MPGTFKQFKARALKQPGVREAYDAPAAALARLAADGAPVREPLHDGGDGIRIAAVADPFVKGSETYFVARKALRATWNEIRL